MKTTSKAAMKRHSVENAIKDELQQVRPERIITTRTGRTVKTTLTDTEACDELEKLAQAGKVSGGFPDSLIKNRHRLSEEQLKWVHVLVIGAKQPKSAAATIKLEVSKLNRMFDNAATTIKFPNVSLSTEDKVEVNVYRATKGKTPGAFQITNGRGWKRPWFGRVLPTGEVQMRDGTPPSVLKLVAALAKDPYATMTKSGHLSGRCSCCNKQLDDPKSVKLGIGPVCIKKWSLAIR